MRRLLHQLRTALEDIDQDPDPETVTLAEQLIDEATSRRKLLYSNDPDALLAAR